jgi:hypothetical protein
MSIQSVIPYFGSAHLAFATCAKVVRTHRGPLVDIEAVKNGD